MTTTADQSPVAAAFASLPNDRLRSLANDAAFANANHYRALAAVEARCNDDRSQLRQGRRPFGVSANALVEVASTASRLQALVGAAVTAGVPEDVLEVVLRASVRGL